MNSLNKTLKKNIAGSFVVKGIGIFVNLALIPIGIDFLDKERFGVWVIINSLLAWLTFFDLGLGNGMRNKLVEAFSKRHIKKARQLISTGYFSLLATVSTIFIVFYLVNTWVNWSIVFNVSPSLNNELSTVLFWAIALFLMQIFLKNIGFIMLSLQMTAINNSLLVISNVLSLTIICTLRAFDISGTLLTYAIIVCGGPVLVYLGTTIVFFAGRFKYLTPNFKYFNKALLQDIGGLGMKFFIIQIAALLLYQGNNIFITQFFGPKEVTNYNVSYRYFNIVLMMFSILLSPFWSAYTKAYSEHNIDWIRSIITKMQKLWAVAILSILLMITAANFAYKLWIGNQIDVSLSMNIANGLYVIIYVWNSIYLYFINGIGKIKLQYYLTIAVLIIYVPFTILLLQLQHTPSIIVFSNCIIQLVFSVVCYLQVNKILKGETYGIWYR